MGRPTQAVILLKALTNNWNLLKRYDSVRAPIIPVLKANAYGHGAAIVGLHLQKLGVRSVAVALVKEARELRTAGFKKQILLLGPFERRQVSELIKLKITPIVSSMECLKSLAIAKNKSKTIKLSRPKKVIRPKFEIHIKWDTSMNRLGFRDEELGEVLALLKSCPHIHLVGLCTHLLKGEDLGTLGGHSERQIKAFAQIEREMKKVQPELALHVFNSDAFFRYLQTKPQNANYGARLGLSLYGHTSVETNLTKKLRPVMKLCSKIVQIKKIHKGETVSYNATWTAKRDSVIAVVPMGYADGYRRGLSNKGQVLVRGMLVSVVGSVCMDYFMIDVTDVCSLHNLTLGEDVELWGPHVNLKDLAKKIDAIPYELITGIGPRVVRVAEDSIE